MMRNTAEILENHQNDLKNARRRLSHFETELAELDDKIDTINSELSEVEDAILDTQETMGRIVLFNSLCNALLFASFVTCILFD